MDAPNNKNAGVQNACFCCRRRKIRCDRSSGGCGGCFKLGVPCRYPLSIMTDVPINSGSARRKKRGPYKKGKRPREKELEEMVLSMATRYDGLKRLLRKQTLLDNYQKAASKDISQGPAVMDPESGGASTASFAYKDLDAPFNVGEWYPRGVGPSSTSPHPTTLHKPERERLDEFDNTRPTEKDWRFEVPLHHPPREQIFELWHIYANRVDPLIKLIHCPTYSGQILEASSTLEGIQISMHMLMFSVYIASISALYEDEVKNRFCKRRDHLLAYYAQEMRKILACSDALQRPNIATLQALVLYAVCLHPSGKDDQSLFPKILKLAIDVARRLGQANDESAATSPYDVEMWRRCWWMLCKIEYQRSQEPGSTVDEELLLSQVPLPLNVNDIDLNPLIQELPRARTGITDMSYYLAILELSRLSSTSKQLDNRSACLDLNSSKLVELGKVVCENVRKIECRYLSHCDTSRPFDWFMLLVGKTILNPVEILLLNHAETAALLSQSRPGSGDQDKEEVQFLCCIDAIECWHFLRTSLVLKPWRWYIWNFQPAFDIDYLCTELGKRSKSAHVDRARALMALELSA